MDASLLSPMALEAYAEMVEPDGTVRFGPDGTDYEIDLSAKHADALRKAPAPYLGAAPSIRLRDPAPNPNHSQGRQHRRTRPHNGPRVGQIPRNRSQRPRPSVRQPDGQVQGRDEPIANPVGCPIREARITFA